MNEVWKAVPGYEGVYSVSNLGRVRRDKAYRGIVAGRLLAGRSRRDGSGYVMVELSIGDVKRAYSVHRLVALAFHGPPRSRRHIINHIDGNKRNNAADNLEWCTVRQNNAHARRIGLCRSRPRRGEDNGRSILTERQVLVIKQLKGKVGQRELAVLAGVARSLIQRIHQGLAWRHVVVPHPNKPGPKYPVLQGA